MSSKASFRKPAMIVLGLSGLGILYLFGVRPYLEKKDMEKFEREANIIYEMRMMRREDEFDRKELGRNI